MLALARTWNIQVDGSGDAPTIQAGIDSASIGDTVLVGPGFYTGRLNFRGKNIAVRSSLGPAQTTIDGSGFPGRVVSFVSGEHRGALLEGFTVTGGQGGIAIMDSEPSIVGNWIMGNHSPEDGGGISCVGDRLVPPSWSPLITDNKVLNNDAQNLGGGLAFTEDMNPEIIDNLISDNETVRGDGGGIYYLNVSAPGTLIRGNSILNNRAGDHGGGIYAAQIGNGLPAQLEIDSNLVWANYAKGSAPITQNSGGGIWLTETNAWVHHNTIVGNEGDGPTDTYGGGIVIDYAGSPTVEQNIIAFSTKGGGLWCGNNASPTIRNNLTWMNTGGDGVGDCATWWQTNGNIVDNPYFCDLAAGDFSVASNSGVMTHPAGPLGAFPIPGCGPVSVRIASWGSLKARYR